MTQETLIKPGFVFSVIRLHISADLVIYLDLTGSHQVQSKLPKKSVKILKLQKVQGKVEEKEGNRKSQVRAKHLNLKRYINVNMFRNLG